MKNNYRLQLETSNKLSTTFKSPDFEHYFNKGIATLSQQPHLMKAMHGGLIQLAFIDDATMQILNKTYRHKDKPTDVLSLSYFHEEPFPNADLVGEIFISVETAARQAKEHDKTLGEELQFLFIHGLLHIFDYDHEEPEERKIMFDLQDKILGTAKWRELLD